MEINIGGEGPTEGLASALSRSLQTIHRVAPLKKKSSRRHKRAAVASAATTTRGADDNLLELLRAVRALADRSSKTPSRTSPRRAATLPHNLTLAPQQRE
jgi:hypothetical protein